MATAKKKLAASPAKPVTAKKSVKPAAKKSPTGKKAVGKAPVKTPVKAPAKTTKPITKKPAAKPVPVKSTKPVKAEKVKKPKLVRDSFTIPKVEYVVLEDLKQRANKLTRPAKKSELLRAGIKALAAMSDAAFLAALEQVPAIKTGRPVSA
jgi:hypothetical protein